MAPDLHPFVIPSTGRGSDLEDFRRSRRRALYAHSLRVDGLKFREIAPLLAVGTKESARQLVNKGARIIDRDYRHVGEACELLIEYVKLKQLGHTLIPYGKFIGRARELQDSLTCPEPSGASTPHR